MKPRIIPSLLVMFMLFYTANMCHSDSDTTNKIPIELKGGSSFFVKASIEEDAVVFENTGVDPQVISKPVSSYDPTAFSTLIIEYKTKTGLDELKAYVNEPFSEERAFIIGKKLAPSNTWKVLTVNLWKVCAPSRETPVKELRLDFGETPGQQISIRNITIVKASDEDKQKIPIELKGGGAFFVKMSIEEDAVVFENTGVDPQVISKPVSSYNPSAFSTLIIEYKTKTGLDELKAYVNEPFGEERAFIIAKNIAPTNTWKVLTVNLWKACASSQETPVKELRLDFGETIGQQISIRNITIVKASEEDKKKMEEKLSFKKKKKHIPENFERISFEKVLTLGGGIFNQNLLNSALLGWSFVKGDGGEGTWRWDAENVYNGEKSCRILKNNIDGYNSLVSDFVNVESGKTYQISAWIKLHSRSYANTYIKVNQYSKDGKTPDRSDDNSAIYQVPFDQRYPAGAWVDARLTFEVKSPNTRIKIQIMVLSGACDVTLSDIRINTPQLRPLGPNLACDAVQGNTFIPSRYEEPKMEIIPPLTEKIKAIVAARKHSEASVETIAERPRIVVDGKPIPPAFYNGCWFAPERSQYGDFKQAGIRTYFVCLQLGRHLNGKGVWLGPDKYDFTGVEDLLWRVLRVDPEANIVLYLGCDPYVDWGKEHPDEVVQNQNGDKAIVDYHTIRFGGEPKSNERFGPSVVSEVYQTECAAALKKLVIYIKGCEAGKAVIGYHLTGFSDGQWYTWGYFSKDEVHLTDYSPGGQRSFKNWLRRLYKNNIEDLRKAWNDNDITFDTAKVPSSERVMTDRFFAGSQNVVDYNIFYSEGVAETILYLAEAIKEASENKLLVGVYYEDISGMGGINSTNHIALGKLLNSNNIDYLSGPTSYRIRKPGYSGAAKSVFGSTLLHNKLFITEQDWRSWCSVPNSAVENFAYGRAETVEEHNAMVRRESGMMIAYGMGTWWYDLAGCWFRDDGIMAGIREAYKAFEQDLTVAGIPKADLAVFISEESDAYMGPRASVITRYGAITKQISELNTSGVPYRLYLLSDLGRIKLPEHRIYMFINCYVMNKIQTKAIEELRRDGNTLVFLHAPGIIDPNNPDYNTLSDDKLEKRSLAIEKITGIKVRALQTVPGAFPVQSSSKLLDNIKDRLALPLFHSINMDIPNRLEDDGIPTFEVIDKNAESLATYPSSKAISIAYKKFKGYQVIYSGVYTLCDQFINNIARQAHAWCISEPGDAVYANENFVTIHAMHELNDGKKGLHLFRPSRVVDLTTGKIVYDKTNLIELKMKIGETKWFRLMPEFNK